MLTCRKVLCWLLPVLYSKCMVNGEHPILSKTFYIKQNLLHVDFNCSFTGQVGDFLYLYQKKGSERLPLKYIQLTDYATNGVLSWHTTFLPSYGDEGTVFYCLQENEYGNFRKKSNEITVKFPSKRYPANEGIKTTNATESNINHRNDKHINRNIPNEDNELNMNGETTKQFKEKAVRNKPSFIENESDSFVQKNTTHNDEQLGQKSWFTLSHLIFTVLTAVVIIIILSGILFFRFRKHPIPAKKQNEESACATEQVTYAILDLQTASTRLVSVPSSDRDPYAEIVGVIRGV